MQAGYPLLTEQGLRIVSGRVRVAVRLRPQNAEETVTDVDFLDCVELKPENMLHILKLRGVWIRARFDQGCTAVGFETQVQLHMYKLSLVAAMPSVRHRFSIRSPDP
ncbi:hypothetical protein Tco_0128858 [Tanacetum coccineum]